MSGNQHFEGTVSIRAPRDTVWAFLTNFQSVIECAPRVERLEVVDEQRAIAHVYPDIGPVKEIAIQLMWLERQAPGRARFQARGKVPGGSVETMTSMALEETGDGATTLRWGLDVKLGGLLGLVAGKRVQGRAEQRADRFFECLRAKLEQPS